MRDTMTKKRSTESTGAAAPGRRGLTLDELDARYGLQLTDFGTEKRIWCCDSTATFCEVRAGDGRFLFLHRLTWNKDHIDDDLYEVVGESAEESDDLDQTRIKLLGNYGDHSDEEVKCPMCGAKQPTLEPT